MTSAFGVTHEVSKVTRHHEEETAAGAAGAGAGQGAYQSAGYKTKHYVDAHTRKGNPGVSADQVRLQDKALKANKKTFGMHLPNGSAGRNNVGYHRAYPKDLPHGRTIRLLGHTHEGRLGVAVGTAATVAGGVAGLGAAHHLTKSAGPAMQRSAFGIEHGTSR